MIYPKSYTNMDNTNRKTSTVSSINVSNAFSNEIEINFQTTPKDIVISVPTQNVNAQNHPRAEKEILRHVIEDEFDLTKNIDSWNWIYLLLILLISIPCTSLIFMIPQDNFIDQPQYWYESLFILITLGPFLTVLTNLQFCHLSLRVTSILSTKSVFNLWVSAASGFCLPYAFFNIIWNSYLGYTNRNPFLLLSTISMFFIFYLVFWFEIPKYLRQIDEFRKKICTFVVIMVWYVLMVFQYKGMSLLLENLPLDMKMTVAAIMPLMRLLNLKLISSLSYKFELYDETMINIATTGFVNFSYSLFMVNTVSFSPQPVTSAILFVEFFRNLYLSYDVFKVHMSVKAIEANQWDVTRIKSIHSLLLNVIIQSIVPIAYLTMFTILKYGSNVWMYDTFTERFMGSGGLDDVSKIVSRVSLIFAVNLISSMFGTILLRELCHVNLYNEFCKMINQCWILLSLLLTSSLFLVSKISERSLVSIS